MAEAALRSGGAVLCPSNDCGPRTVYVDITYDSGGRETHSALSDPFAAYGGGSGFRFGGSLWQQGEAVVFRGDPAQAAANSFFAGMADGRNFGVAVNRALDSGFEELRRQALARRSHHPQNSLNDLLQEGKDELIKRITERKSCADVFGGMKKALKALNQLKFNPGLLDNGGIMEIKGNKVTVDTNRFTESGQPLPLALNIQKSTVQGHPSTRYDLMSLKISGTEFAAFAIGHELGHKRNIYGEYNNDGSSAFSNLEAGANNEKIRKACFAEFAPEPLR